MSPCEKAAVANTYGAKFHGDVRGASYVVKLTIILPDSPLYKDGTSKSNILKVN
jgi:hypothetical protein